MLFHGRPQGPGPGPGVGDLAGDVGVQLPEHPQFQRLGPRGVEIRVHRNRQQGDVGELPGPQPEMRQKKDLGERLAPVEHHGVGEQFLHMPQVHGPAGEEGVGLAGVALEVAHGEEGLLEEIALQQLLQLLPPGAPRHQVALARLQAGVGEKDPLGGRDQAKQLRRLTRGVEGETHGPIIAEKRECPGKGGGRPTLGPILAS